MALLQIDTMTHYFGGLRAVYNYELEIEPGEIRGLIGPNGAGKTTIFNLITGIYRPTEGKIFFEGKELNGLSPHEIASLGIGRTFQNMLLWRHMTVLEHVKMARYSTFDPVERKKAVGMMKNGIDEAFDLGASTARVFSGKHPGDDKKEDAKKIHDETPFYDKGNLFLIFFYFCYLFICK